MSDAATLTDKTGREASAVPVNLRTSGPAAKTQTDVNRIHYSSRHFTTKKKKVG